MKSIKSYVIISLICMAILILLSSYSYFTSFNSVGKKYDNFMQRNTDLAMLLKVKEDEHKEFIQYLRTRKDEYYKAYIENRETIDQLLVKIKTETKTGQGTLTSIRIISSMHNYISGSISKMISKDQLSINDYKEIQYIELIYKELSVQIQELIFKDIERSNIEHQNTFGTYMREKLMVFIVIMIGIFLAFSILVFILSTIYKKMYQLVNYADALSRNQWGIKDLNENSYIELNKVVQAFNNMKHRIYENIEEIKRKSQVEIELHKNQLENEKKDKMLKQAQLTTLQMQINPHFLFNTLNIIGKSTVLEDPEQSLELIEDISKILRYSLEHPKELVLLEEEIDVVESYLSIQRTRFQSQISFDLEIDLDISNIYIPPMIIQPLIENAIKHGLTDTKVGGHVQISLTTDRAFLYIRVRDNGKGFEQNNQVIQENPGSIGLYNVFKRLELQYKRDDVILIDSIKDKHTIVTLKIPCTTEISKDFAEEGEQ